MHVHIAYFCRVYILISNVSVPVVQYNDLTATVWKYWITDSGSAKGSATIMKLILGVLIGVVVIDAELVCFLVQSITNVDFNIMKEVRSVSQSSKEGAARSMRRISFSESLMTRTDTKTLIQTLYLVLILPVAFFSLPACH